LVSGAWTAVTPVPQPGVGNAYTVTIPHTGPQYFFRLRK